MTSIRHVLASALLCLCALSAYGQARVDGQVYSLMYARENLAENQQLDYYQGLLLNARPFAETDLSFKTNLRVARVGDPAEWDERIYSLYGDWRAAGGRFQARLGRQFVYRGVVNGSIDGVTLRAEPVENLDVQLVGGVAVPFSRPFDVERWDAANVLGGYAAYRFAPGARVDLSYITRSRDGDAVWQQVGSALTGTVARRLNYFAQLEYNLLAEEVQGQRYRLTYRPGHWSLTGEFNSQKPRVFEDSFFNVFELRSFDQFRGAVGYLLGRYELNVQALHTMFANDETADEVIATIGRSRLGNIGVIYQTGFGGDNVGLYGNVDYDVLDNLTFRLRSRYYSYTRRTIDIGQDATAFSAGFLFRPVAPVLVQAEVQESMNTFFDNDLRALFRVSYSFGRAGRRIGPTTM